MSKLIFGIEDPFSEEDKVSLFTSWEKVAELCETQPEAHEKHYWFVFITRSIIQSLDNVCRSKELRTQAQKELLPYLSHGRGYFSPQIYFGLKNQCKLLYQAFLKHRFPQVFAPEKYVGVGYGDKGTARDSARDGTPPWTEMALDERKVDREKSYAGWTEKTTSIWTQLAIHPLQRMVARKGSQKEEEIPLEITRETRQRIFSDTKAERLFLQKVEMKLQTE